MQPTIPAPLAAAFENQVTISAAELCRLIPMDDATLRRHVRAGTIGYRRIGHGASAPRRFTLEDVIAFLEVRYERECPVLRQPRLSGSRSSGGAVSGVMNEIKRKIAERKAEKAMAKEGKR